MLFKFAYDDKFMEDILAFKILSVYFNFTPFSAHSLLRINQEWRSRNPTGALKKIQLLI